MGENKRPNRRVSALRFSTQRLSTSRAGLPGFRNVRTSISRAMGATKVLNIQEEEETEETSRHDKLMKKSQEVVKDLAEVREKLKNLDTEIAASISDIVNRMNELDPPNVTNTTKRVQSKITRKQAKLKALWKSTNVYMKEIKASYKDIASTIHKYPDEAEEHLDQILDSMDTVRHFYNLYKAEGEKFLKDAPHILEEVETIKPIQYNRQSKMRAAILTEKESHAMDAAEAFAQQLAKEVKANESIGVVEIVQKVKHRSREVNKKKGKASRFIFSRKKKQKPTKESKPAKSRNNEINIPNKEKPIESTTTEPQEQRLNVQQSNQIEEPKLEENDSNEMKTLSTLDIIETGRLLAEGKLLKDGNKSNKSMFFETPAEKATKIRTPRSSGLVEKARTPRSSELAEKSKTSKSSKLAENERTPRTSELAEKARTPRASDLAENARKPRISDNYLKNARKPRISDNYLKNVRIPRISGQKSKNDSNTTEEERKPRISRFGFQKNLAGQKPCLVCTKAVDTVSLNSYERFKDSQNNFYHRKCLKCKDCQVSLRPGVFYKLKSPETEESSTEQERFDIYCSTHYDEAKKRMKPEPRVLTYQRPKRKPVNATANTAAMKLGYNNSTPVNSLPNTNVDSKNTQDIQDKPKPVRTKRGSVLNITVDKHNLKPCLVCKKEINLISTPLWERHKDSVGNHYHGSCLRCAVCQCNLSKGGFEKMETEKGLQILCARHFSVLKQFSTGNEILKGTPKDSMEHRTSVTRGRNSIKRGHIVRVKEEIGEALERMFDGLQPVCVACGLELDTVKMKNIENDHKTHIQCPSPEEVARTKAGNIRLIVRKLPRRMPIKFHFDNGQVRTYFFDLDPEYLEFALKQGQRDDATVRYIAETPDDVKKRRSTKRPVKFAIEDSMAVGFKAELLSDLSHTLTRGCSIQDQTVKTETGADSIDDYYTAKGTFERGLIYTLAAKVSHNKTTGTIFPVDLELEISRVDI